MLGAGSMDHISQPSYHQSMMSDSTLMPGDAKRANRDALNESAPDRIAEGSYIHAKNSGTAVADVRAADEEEEVDAPAGDTPAKANAADVEWKAQRPSPMLETEQGNVFSPLTCVAKRERIMKFFMAKSLPAETQRAVWTLSKWKQSGAGNAVWLLLIPYGFSEVPAQFMKNGGERAIALASAMRAWDLERKCPPNEHEWREALTEALSVLRGHAQVLCPDFKNEAIFDIPKVMALSSWGAFSSPSVVERTLQAIVDDATVSLEDESKPFKYYSMNNQVKLMREGQSIINRLKRAIRVKGHHAD